MSPLAQGWRGGSGWRLFLVNRLKSICRRFAPLSRARERGRGEGRRVASTMRCHFVEAPALTPTPLPQAVWTGDIGNRCARTWVTLFPLSQREENVALEPNHREAAKRRVRPPGTPGGRQYCGALPPLLHQPQDRLQVVEPRGSGRPNSAAT
ncbi:protein of unknown function (plasmid) [Cupriavidus taiwanensis]|nr:protein of unknown function [Cupriavidus taiwanensis]